MTPEPDTFDRRLQRFMDAKGFNQTSLARKSGIERTVINRLLKGTRQPKAFEIGVLAQSLGVSPEELMSGLELPPQIQRAVDKDREQTERVLLAEAAKDEAVARANQLGHELDRERGERARAQEDLQRAHDLQLREVHELHASQRETSQKAIRNLKLMLEKDSARVRDSMATEARLRAQIKQLLQSLAQERSTKAASSLFAGLAGAMIGRSLD